MIDWLRIRNNTLNILFCLTLAIFVASILSIPIYLLDINSNFSPFNVGFSKTELLKEYLHLMDYLINPLANHLRFLYFKASTSGLAHFLDVKELMLVNNFILLITIILKCIFKVKLHFYKNDAIVIGVFPLMVGLLAALNFEQFFILFHQMLFTNSDWLFNPLTDPIINVLPEYFFEQLIVLALCTFEVLIVIGYWNKKRAKL